MGNDVSNLVNVQNQFTNNFTQSLTENCNANCNIDISDNTIIIGSGSSVGDIIISAGDGCQADATCSMTQSANSTITNILTSMIDQELTSVTDMFGDFQSSDLDNTARVSTTVSNYITQISDQTCQANASITEDDNTIYVGSGTSAGEVTITGGSGSTASASCAMSNMAKIGAYNQSTTKDNQGNASKGMFAMVGLVLIVLMIVGGIIVIVLAASGSLGKIFGGGSKGNDDLDPDTVNEFAESYMGSGGSEKAAGEAEELMETV